MSPNINDFNVQKLGPCNVHTPMVSTQYVDDEDRVMYISSKKDFMLSQQKDSEIIGFEIAGPRSHIYFDPSKLRCGIVTCGGICPGLNDVIRAIVLSLHFHYNITDVYGFRYGYEGLSSKHRHKPLHLTPAYVGEIHKIGGTVLGSSRGPQEVGDMVDNLERMNIGILFTIGGDGTLKGAQAISEEIAQRGLKISVIGIPKTIDNDISYLHESFGFKTAVAEAGSAIYSAHVEALGTHNGIGLVKLMGRHSGYISTYASLAFSDVNFCLIPEVSFSLEKFLEALRIRLKNRGHAVIVAAEGTGQDILGSSSEHDASGNIKLQDIGLFLKNAINNYFAKIEMEVSLKYIDPSYTIRSKPANPQDSVFCLLLGHNAVHAGMAGRTNMLVGFWNGNFTHVPIPLAVSRRNQIDPHGRLWGSVLESTGQVDDIDFMGELHDF